MSNIILFGVLLLFLIVFICLYSCMIMSSIQSDNEEKRHKEEMNKVIYNPKYDGKATIVDGYNPHVL